jgi:hypothetical protein
MEGEITQDLTCGGMIWIEKTVEEKDTLHPTATRFAANTFVS